MQFMEQSLKHYSSLNTKYTKLEICWKKISFNTTRTFIGKDEHLDLFIY